jgi:hypothetical protein
MNVQATNEIGELTTAELGEVSGGTAPGTSGVCNTWGCSTILNPFLAGTNSQGDLGPVTSQDQYGLPRIVIHW